MKVTVADILSTDVLGEAVVLAGEAGLLRDVSWTAVIEWPVEDFVRPGEFVLTTALSCDEARFERMVDEICDSGAAALCVSLPEDSPLAVIRDRVLALADERGFPIIQVPWSVRFAEIMMAVTDRVIAQRYAAILEEPDRLAETFTGALLAGAGLEAVCEALEGMLQRPVLVLSPELHVMAAGGLARSRHEELLAGIDETVDELSAERRQSLRGDIDGASARLTSGLPEIGLGAGSSRRRPRGAGLWPTCTSWSTTASRSPRRWRFAPSNTPPPRPRSRCSGCGLPRTPRRSHAGTSSGVSPWAVPGSARTWSPGPRCSATTCASPTTLRSVRSPARISRSALEIAEEVAAALHDVAAGSDMLVTSRHEHVLVLHRRSGALREYLERVLRPDGSLSWGAASPARHAAGAAQGAPRRPVRSRWAWSSMVPARWPTAYARPVPHA
ncbi:MAG: PucR family transcriptional regulator ligand-binding domain-containing protein [Solirubrobacteraceae bacterium]